MRQKLINSNENILRRLEKLSDKTDTCWLFKGHIDKMGYGSMCIQTNRGPRGMNTHRLSAMIHLGLEIYDTGTYVLHLPICKNKHCWNPAHLYLGDASENKRDELESKDFLCKRGHRILGRNEYVTPDGRRQCRECMRIRARNFAERKRNSLKETEHCRP